MNRKVVKGIPINDHKANNAIKDYKPLNFDIVNKDVLA